MCVSAFAPSILKNIFFHKPDNIVWLIITLSWLKLPYIKTILIDFT